MKVAELMVEWGYSCIWGQCPKGKETEHHQKDWKTRLQGILGMERNGGDLIKITKDND